MTAPRQAKKAKAFRVHSWYGPLGGHLTCIPDLSNKKLANATIVPDGASMPVDRLKERVFEAAMKRHEVPFTNKPPNLAYVDADSDLVKACAAYLKRHPKGLKVDKS